MVYRKGGAGRGRRRRGIRDRFDALADEPKLADLHLLPAARGDLLARAGRRDEAVAARGLAMELAPTGQERRQLARRREELRSPGLAA